MSTDLKQDEPRSEIYLRALELAAQTSSALLGTERPSSEVWQRIPRAALELTGMSMGSVVVLEGGGETIRFVADTGTLPSMCGQSFPLSSMPVPARAVRERRSISSGDLEVDLHLRANEDLIERYRVRAILVTPLMAGDEVVGLLMLGSEKPRVLTSTDIRVAEVWAGLAAVAIVNERLYAQTAQALEAQKRLIVQRDALFAVNEAILSAKTFSEVLELIAEMIPPALHIDWCQVILRTEDPDELFIAATTRKYHFNIDKTRFRHAGTNSGKVLESCQTILIDDGPDNPTLHPVFRKILPCGSVYYLPIVGGIGKAIGVLVLAKEAQGGFTAEQISLAQLFAPRAAAAVENAQLLDQTRRDAQTKEMLLRELNHRVKNNMAGIAALLEIDRPPMPAQARKWLERVTDRIRSMAHTHAMFISHLNRLGLQELIEQTFKHLAVVTSPGVDFQCDVRVTDIRLRSERAISVAMALYELCYNAVIHGLKNKGMLVVRANCESPRKIIIDVIDNGCGQVSADGEISDSDSGNSSQSITPHDSEDDRTSSRSQPSAAVAAEPAQHGLGLNLVRDFVSRELRGEFRLLPTPGGGVTARIEFVLLEDETP